MPKLGETKVIEKVETPAPGEMAKPVKPGRIATFDSPFSLDGVASMMGGRKKFWGFMRLSQEPEVRAVLARYDALSKSKQASASIDKVCADTGTDPAWLFGEVAKTAAQVNADMTKLVHVINAPAVTGALVEQAQKPEGDKARDQFFKNLCMGPPSRQTPMNQFGIFYNSGQDQAAGPPDTNEPPAAIPAGFTPIEELNRVDPTLGKVEEEDVENPSQED